MNARRLVISGLILSLLVGCRGGPDSTEPPSAAAALARAGELLHPYDFGERYSEGIALLAEIPKMEGATKDQAMDAFLLRAEALTDLFLVARATGDAALGETLERVADWELEGDLSNPRNFQILAQEIQDIFALVLREVGAEDPRGARAEAMVRFMHDVQALLFVKKDKLLETMDSLEKGLDGRYASRVAVVRLGELFRPGVRTWRDEAVTTLGFCCPDAAPGLFRALCLPDPEAEVLGQCLMDVGLEFGPDRRKAAGLALEQGCRSLGDEGQGAQEKITAWYTAQLETVRGGDAPLDQWLEAHTLGQWAAGLDEALAPAFALTQSD